MTEQEWLTNNDAKPMLELLRDWPNERKIRLFACDCCRRLWHRTTELDRAMVAAIEQCADGVFSAGKIFATAAVKSTVDGYPPASYHVSAAEAERVISEAALQNAWTGATRARAFVVDAVRQAEGRTGRAMEWKRQADTLRCIFGNPFRPVAFDPEWRTPTVMQLASHFYETHDFDQMPILADALQDAGCNNEDVLNHGRDGIEVHVRGGWVVDLVLGKS